MEDLSSQMEMSTRENGKKTKLMDMVYIDMQMGPFMKVNGKMINKKDMEEKNGLIKVASKEYIKMEKSMVLESLFGQMELVMKVIGNQTKCMEKESLNG
jgi:hypothetical protein